MKLFFSVGEPSGDLHGANLILELRATRADWEFVGFGGPRMAAAGCELHTDLTQLAIMGFFRVLTYIPRLVGLLRQTNRYFRDHRPDAVILIDYPGFNWWVARRAKAQDIPVYYYGVPQMWGWAPWRIKKMRRLVDHALCKLPFEEPWYRERGCRATYVGHPYFDELESRKLDEEFLDDLRDTPGPLVTILPGSRTHEVRDNLEQLLAAARRVKEKVPQVRFAIASFKESQTELARRIVAAAEMDAVVYVHRTPELIEAATCCMAVSGSVSLELLYHAKPSVVLYVAPLYGFVFQHYFRTVRYFTLVNLLTAPAITQPGGYYDPTDPRDAHVLIPEYFTMGDKSAQLAGHLIEWLTDPMARARRITQLTELRERIAHPGASRRAAEYVVQTLESPATIKIRPAA